MPLLLYQLQAIHYIRYQLCSWASSYYSASKRQNQTPTINFFNRVCQLMNSSIIYVSVFLLTPTPLAFVCQKEVAVVLSSHHYNYQAYNYQAQTTHNRI